MISFRLKQMELTNFRCFEFLDLKREDLDAFPG